MSIIATVAKCAALLACLTGCAVSPPTLETGSDPYTGERQYMLSSIYPDSCPGDYQFLSVRLFFIGSGDLHTLAVEYTGPDWPRMDTWTGMDLLIDNEYVTLPGLPRRQRTALDHGGVKETAYFVLSPEMLSRLSAAQTARFRVLGRDFPIEKCLTREHLAHLHQVERLN